MPKSKRTRGARFEEYEIEGVGKAGVCDAGVVPQLRRDETRPSMRIVLAERRRAQELIDPSSSRVASANAEETIRGAQTCEVIVAVTSRPKGIDEAVASGIRFERKKASTPIRAEEEMNFLNKPNAMPLG